MHGILTYAFVRNALATGIFIAIVSGAIGYFLTLRGYTFAAHALPNIGFSGAAGAVLLAVPPVYGLVVATVVAAVGIGIFGERADSRDTSIGVIMSFALGLGLMFLSLYRGFAERVYSVLFGSIVGITAGDTLRAFAVAVVGLLVIGFLGRPLLFLSYDSEVAEARGVAVRTIWIVLLCVAAVVVAVAVQVVGTLLVFALLVGPAATASRLTHRPLVSIAFASGLGTLYIAVGILLSAVLSGVPVGFFVTTIAFAVYLPVRILSGRGTAERRATT